MRIAVIGGTTFIGPNVVRALAAPPHNHDIIVYHRGQHESHFPPTVKHVRHPDAGIPVVEFGPELKEPAPDVVLHMVPMGARDAAAFVRTFSGLAKRAVVISSNDVYAAYGRVYGTEPDPADAAERRRPLKESAPLRKTFYPYRALATPGDWTYDYEKILVEQACREAAPKFPVTILRLPAVYGPHDPTRRLFPYLKRMDDQRPAILLDKARAQWRFTHDFVENTAAAITLAVTDDRAAGKTYNVGPETTPTTREWVSLIAKAAAWNGRVVELPTDKLPKHLREKADFSHDIHLDSSAIRNDLGFQPPVPLEEAIRRTVAWDRAVPPEKVSQSQYDYAAEDAAISAA